MRSNSTSDGNWLYLFLAVLMAAILWYMVNAREQIERLVDVRLDYKGLPDGLTVLDGQMSKIQVRVRGPRELFRSIESRDISFTVDLSEVTKGINVIPFDKDRHQALRMYQVLEIIPSRLTLDVDSLTRKEVPVTVSTRHSERFADADVRWLSIAPQTVRLSGPESVLAPIRSINVEALPDSLSEDVRHFIEVPVLAPSGVEVEPASVSAEYAVSLNRQSLMLVRPLLLEGDASHCTTRATRVRLKVAVPDRLATDESYLEKIRAAVSIGDYEVSDAGVPIRVDLPEGARLESIAPAMAILHCE